MQNKFSLLTLALISAFSASATWAADDSSNDKSEPEVQAEQNLSKIVVVGRSFAQKMGSQRITSQQIATLPHNNGTITDFLHRNPNVRFSAISNSSNTAGEIAPENVSFHGSKFYTNSWQIDGMSNNNNINPGQGAGYMNNSATTPGGSGGGEADFDELPNGNPQAFWVNADIVDRVDVYDSNISAKYGEFSGGVVDAKLKDPDTQRMSGSVSMRTTRDAWTSFHPETEQDVTLAQQNLYYQPRFVKYIYGLNLNLPINDKAAVLFSYNRTQSKIPFYHQVMQRWGAQKRLAQTFVLKGLYRFDNGDKVTATAMYSPHEQKYQRASVKDGAYTSSGGGYRFNLNWTHLFEKGQVETILGMQSFRNRVENESDYYISYSLAKRLPSATATGVNPRCATTAVCYANNVPDWLDWVSSYRTTNESAGRSLPALAGKIGDPWTANYGGYGTFETWRKSYTLKQDYTFDELRLGNVKHSLAFGWQAEWAQAGYERLRDAYNYTGATMRSTYGYTCLPNDHGCIDGQYATSRNRFPARSVKAGNNHYALYFEDKINWGRLELTPGVRIDHDRFLKNTDIGWRFTGSLDVFGNDKTRIFGGVNRYYDQSMLAHKLKSRIGVGYIESRKLPSDPWVTGSERLSTDFEQPDNLRTPFSQEVNLGWRQIIGNTEWTLKWVRRNGYDGLAWDTAATRLRTLTNRGRSSGDTFTLAFNMLRPIKWKYVHLDMSGGIGFSKNTANNSSYDNTSVNSRDNGRLTETPAKVIIDGKLMDQTDMPAIDYNTPITASMTINAAFPLWNFNWATTFNYTGRTAQYSPHSERCPAINPDICGSYAGGVYVYDNVRRPSLFTVDFAFLKTFRMGQNSGFDVKLDVINAFNRVVKTRISRANVSGTYIPNYTQGRSFWLDLRYHW